MPKPIRPFQRAVCAALALTLTVQPVFAATYQYNVNVPGFVGAPVSPGTGVGDGTIDIGVDAVRAKLQLSSSKMDFRLFTSDTPATQRSVLMNVGTGPAVLSGIASSADFKVTSDCVSPLAPDTGCTLTSTFTPGAVGDFDYRMTVSAKGATAPVSVLMVASVTTLATAPPAPRLRLDTDVMSFGTVEPGVASTQTVALTNVGTMAAQLSGIESGDEFLVSSDCPSVLPPAQSCTITASFSSLISAPHSFTMQLHASETVPDVPLTLYAVVRAVPDKVPALSFSKPMLDFAVAPAQAQATVLSNLGTAPALLTGIQSNDDFDVSSDCPSTLPMNAVCTISATLRPAAPGNAQYYMVAKAQGKARAPLLMLGPVTARNPEGTEAPSDPQSPTKGLVFSPVGLAFGARTVGQSAVLSANLMNEGDTEATLTAMKLPYAGDFVQQNDCGATLAPGAMCTVQVTFAPKAAGAQVGVVQAGSLALRLEGVGVSAGLGVGPTALNFGTMLPGTSVRRVLHVGNTGNVTLTGLQITGPAAPVVLESSTCAETIAAFQGCTVTLRASPSDLGPFSGSLRLSSDNGGTATVALSGQVVQLRTSPSALVFPDTLLNASAPVQQVTLTNEGPQTLPLQLGMSGGASHFNQSNNCGAQLAGGASCTVSVRFTPAAGGALAGEVGIVSGDAVLGRIRLEGKSLDLRLSLSQSGLAFGEIRVGQKSAVQSLVIKNETAYSVTITGLGVAAGATDFSQSNNCGSQLAASASCTVDVQLIPTVAGTRAGTLGLATSMGQYAVALSGKGTEALPDGILTGTQELSFGPMPVGVTIRRVVSLSNSGAYPLTGLEIVSPAAPFIVESTTCPATLEARQGCIVTLAASPTAAGDFLGSLQVNSAKGGTLAVRLTGTALNLSVSPSVLPFPDTRLGTSANQSVTLTNEGPNGVNLQMGVSAGAENFNQSNNCGASLAGGASCTVAVQFTPSAEGAMQGEVGVASGSVALARIALTGTGFVPRLTLSSTTLAFDSANVGKTTAKQTLTIKNDTNYGADITGLGIAAGGSDFAQSNNCGTLLAPSSSCKVDVQMTPAASGDRTGTLGLVTSLGQHVVSLSGTGTVPNSELTGPGAPPVVVGPPVPDGYTHYAINFLETEFGTSSAVRNVVFSNVGTGPLAITGISVVAGMADFAQSNNCGPTLAPQTSCTIAMRFTPTAAGKRTGAIALTSETGNYYFEMTGTGAAASGTWTANTSADFGAVVRGSAVSRNFTFTNTGTVPARNVVTELVGQDLFLVTNTCGSASASVTVAAGYTCSVTVRYTPLEYGNLTSARLSTTGGMVNSPATLTLTGSAPAPSLAFDAAPTGAYGSLTLNSANPRTFVLRNTSQLGDTLAAIPTVTGAGFSRTAGTCVSGTVLAAGATCTVTVTASSVESGPATGALAASATSAASANLELSADYVRPTYSLSHAADSAMTPQADFGAVPIDKPVSATRTYYLRDNTGSAALAVTKAVTAGSSAFSVAAVDVVTSAGVVEKSCTLVAGGVTSDCKASAAGRAIRVKVNVTTTTVGAVSGTVHLEHNGAGYLTELALTATGADMPSDPYFDKVLVLMHMDGAGAGFDFVDEKGSVVTNVGNALRYPYGAPFGTSSLYANSGTVTEGLAVRTTAIGTEDFTIEGWVRGGTPTNKGMFVDTRTAGATGYGPVIAIDGNKFIYCVTNLTCIAGASQITGGTAPGYFQHVAVSRSAGVTRMFVGGVKVGVDYTTKDYLGVTKYLLGQSTQASAYTTGTGVDEFRITKGIGRYTVNFPAPTKAFPNF